MAFNAPRPVLWAIVQLLLLLQVSSDFCASSQDETCDGCFHARDVSGDDVVAVATEALGSDEASVGTWCVLSAAAQMVAGTNWCVEIFYSAAKKSSSLNNDVLSSGCHYVRGTLYEHWDGSFPYAPDLSVNSTDCALSSVTAVCADTAVLGNIEPDSEDDDSRPAMAMSSLAWSAIASGALVTTLAGAFIATGVYRSRRRHAASKTEASALPREGDAPTGLGVIQLTTSIDALALPDPEKAATI